MHLEKRNNAVINLTSSRSCGRQNMRDIKTLLTAPISRISSRPQGRDDEGRKNKENVGQVLPVNQIKRHSRMSLSGIPTAFNNAQGGDSRTLRAAASGMTALLNSINPSPALRAPSPARGEENDTRPSSPRSVGMRGIGAPRGFTLIELLVVVLIIGILAAIALPQYQKVIERSKAQHAIVLLNTLNKARHLYYLQHGQLPTQFSQLDVTLPPRKGAVKWVYSNVSDTYSTDYWSIQLFNSTRYGTGVYIGIIKGPYKGAGFTTREFAPGSIFTIQCLEKLSDGLPFTKPAGAYCADIMHMHLTNSSSTARSYYF